MYQIIYNKNEGSHFKNNSFFTGHEVVKNIKSSKIRYLNLLKNSKNQNFYKFIIKHEGKDFSL